jgi:hypothetical protein
MLYFKTQLMTTSIAFLDPGRQINILSRDARPSLGRFSAAHGWVRMGIQHKILLPGTNGWQATHATLIWLNEGLW